MATPEARPGQDEAAAATGPRRALAFLLVAFALYAAAYIARSSFEIAGERYFCLLDDAMISMRYARNLAEGYGLVWNPGGEAVEGYTNPLWVAVMALFHLVPVAASKTSLLVQVFALALLGANLLYVWKIAALVRADGVAVPAGSVALTAFYLPLNYWGLMGMEVSLVTLATTAAVYETLGSASGNRPPTRALVILAASTLVRMDMAAPYLAVLAFSLAADPKDRRRRAVVGIALLAAFLAAQTALRLWYYGDLLPNTYYLKLDGFPFWRRIARGASVLGDYFIEMAIVPLVLAAWYVVRRASRPVYLLAWIFFGQCLYSVYVGGDAWERLGGSNRYVSIAVPLFFVLVAAGAREAVDVALRRVVSLARLRNAAFAGSIAVCLLLLNNIAGTGDPRLAEWALLAPNPARVNNELAVNQGLAIRSATAPEATVAVVCAGATPYFADRVAVDLLGKCDRVVAHERMRRSGAEDEYLSFYPGHLKWNYAYSIGQLEPDLVVQLWMDPGEAAPFLDASYLPVWLAGTEMYARRGSPRVAWDTLRGATAAPVGLTFEESEPQASRESDPARSGGRPGPQRRRST